MSIEDNTTAEVALRVIETRPAVINFNYQEISDQLDSVLAKYKDLMFDESTVVGCKKTIAELRKGQKALDEFRKITKKELTESVTAFENQCKTLSLKFTNVIEPLTQQEQQFELGRREIKRKEIQTVIDVLIKEQGLTEKYASRLVVMEEYLNKGKTLKAIKTELSALASTLKIQQDKEEQDINLIATKVELANVQYQLSNVLIPSSYLRLLSYKSVAEIDLLITSDAQEISNREKKAAEFSAPEIGEAPKATVIDIPKPFKWTGSVQTTVPVAAPASNKLITVLYEITGTEEQLSSLEAYFETNNLTWADRPNE